MKRFSITDFGAEPNMGRPVTTSIQAALDEATSQGGATVVIPFGEFITGSLNLGRASLHLEKGAVLKGSPYIEDYPFNGYHHNEMGETLSLLYVFDGADITISGEGTIDLNGEAFYNMQEASVPKCGFEMTEKQKAECTRTYKKRPNQPLFFLRCQRVKIKDIHIMNAPCWTMSFVECQDVSVLDVVIDNSDILPNNDGMHFCSCQNVFVRGCRITSGDDCIALSAITDWNKPCEDVVISDCILQSSSKAIVIGYMHSIVRNVVISNCIIRDSHRALCIMTSSETGLVENVLVSNMRLDTRIRAGNWWGNGEPVAIIATAHHNANYAHERPNRRYPVNVRNIRFHNLICTGENAIGIVGENRNIRNVGFDGLQMMRKPSENLMVKGNLIDLSPGVQKAVLPDHPLCWLHLQDVEDISFRNVSVSPYEGELLTVSEVDCGAIDMERVHDS